MKLPPYTGQEKWEVLHNRFEAVADLKGWNKHDKLQELLPRLHGEAGDFTFDQLSKKAVKISVAGPPVWFLHPGFYMLYNRASLTRPQISQHSLLSVAFSY
jgi:hypothetical protein